MSFYDIINSLSINVTNTRMKNLKLFFVMGALIIAGAIFHSCQKEIPDSQAASGSKMVMGTYTDCTECIDLTADPVLYYEKTALQTVNWGTKTAPFSKNVDIIYYNTEDNFVIKVRSTNGWSDLIIDEVSSWTNGPIAPNVYGEYIVPLPVGWQACDDYNFTLQVAGNGPQAVFTIEYQLIGVCCAGCPGTVTDYDNNVYNVVKIGDQCWMAENLKTTHYRNGDPIDYILDNDATNWSSNTAGAYGFQDNSETYKSTYGALYNTYAVFNNKGLCPTGWHVPSDQEWKTMEIAIGMAPTETDSWSSIRGTDEGYELRGALIPWTCSSVYGNDAWGFNALPAGYRNYLDGGTASVGYVANFWTTTPDPWSPTTHITNRIINCDNVHIMRNGAPLNSGASVRCIKD
jgi:uncharacterized protein (TIGR02145 family)